MKSTYQLDKEEAILLVIDLQERLMPAMYDRDLLLKQASMLLQVAKVFNLPVVMTEQYPRGLGHTVDLLLSLIESEELPVDVFHKTSFLRKLGVVALVFSRQHRVSTKPDRVEVPVSLREIELPDQRGS
jgi:hypothetical protein